MECNGLRCTYSLERKTQKSTLPNQNEIGIHRFFSLFLDVEKENHPKDVSFFNPENIADMPGLLSANLMVVCTNYVKFDSVGEA